MKAKTIVLDEADIDLIYRVMNNFESTIQLLEMNEIGSEHAADYNREVLADFKLFITEKIRK